jgi:transcriptional regulator with XRE-family HTH domain
MTDDVAIGEVLAALRHARGFTTLRSLAAATHLSASQLCRIEAGKKPLTEQAARALERALDSPYPTMIATEGDRVKRRALVAAISAAVSSPEAAAELLRMKLLRATQEEPIDWDARVASHAQRLVRDPSEAFGSTLQADLLSVQSKIEGAGAPSLDSFRTAAGLAQVYGLWLGNCGNLNTAHTWYDSAVRLADSSRDTDLRTFTRGRSAARGVYEGWSIGRTLDTVREVLALTKRPTVGAVEAHAAEITAHSLTGDVHAGRRAVARMRDLVEHLPDVPLRAGAAPVERVAFLEGFLECRVGSLETAEAACGRAMPVLEAWPLWQAELKVCLGRARVAHGDIRAGLALAVSTCQEVKHNVRVIGVAAADLLSCLPRQRRSDEAHALAGYAAKGPMPWEAAR